MKSEKENANNRSGTPYVRSYVTNVYIIRHKKVPFCCLFKIHLLKQEMQVKQETDGKKQHHRRHYYIRS